MIEIILADDNKELTNLLGEYFNNSSEFRLKGIANDGEEVLKLVSQTTFDVLVLDNVMPKIDGRGVLERIDNTDISIIMLTILSKESLIKEFMELGVDYYIAKPFKTSELAARIKQISNKEDSSYINDLAKGNKVNENNLNQQIVNILQKLGVPAHLKGYKYIKNAIKESIKNDDLLTKVTKNLYPLLAHKYNTTYNAIESSMRHAIKTTFKNGNQKFIDELFGETIHTYSNIPTNSHFISQLLEKLKN